MYETNLCTLTHVWMYRVQSLFVHAYLRPFPTSEEWQFLGGRRRENPEKYASRSGDSDPLVAQ